MVRERAGVQRKTGDDAPVSTTFSFGLLLPAKLHPLVLVRLGVQHLHHDALCRAGRGSAGSDDGWRGRLRGRAGARRARLRCCLRGSAADHRLLPVDAPALAPRRGLTGEGKPGCDDGNRHYVSHISTSLTRHSNRDSWLCHCLVTLTEAVAALPAASSARAEIVELLFLPLALGTLQL